MSQPMFEEDYDEDDSSMSPPSPKRSKLHNTLSSSSMHVDDEDHAAAVDDKDDKEHRNTMDEAVDKEPSTTMDDEDESFAVLDAIESELRTPFDMCHITTLPNNVTVKSLATVVLNTSDDALTKFVYVLNAAIGKSMAGNVVVRFERCALRGDSGRMVIYDNHQCDIIFLAKLSVKFVNEERPHFHHPPSVYVDASILLRRLQTMIEKSMGFFFYLIVQPERLMFVTTPKEDMQIVSQLDVPSTTAALPSIVAPSPDSAILRDLENMIPGAVVQVPASNTTVKSIVRTGRNVRTECVLTMGTVAIPDALMDDSIPKYPLKPESLDYHLLPPMDMYRQHVENTAQFFDVELSSSFCNNIVWPSKSNSSSSSGGGKSSGGNSSSSGMSDALMGIKHRIQDGEGDAICTQTLTLVIDNHSSDAINAQTQEIRFSSRDSMWKSGHITECIVFDSNAANIPLGVNASAPPGQLKSVAVPCHKLQRCVGHLPKDVSVVMSMPREVYGDTSFNHVVFTIKPADDPTSTISPIALNHNHPTADNWFEINFLIPNRDLRPDEISSKTSDFEKRSAIISQLIPRADETDMFGIPVRSAGNKRTFSSATHAARGNKNEENDYMVDSF